MVENKAVINSMLPLQFVFERVSRKCAATEENVKELFRRRRKAHFSGQLDESAAMEFLGFSVGFCQQVCPVDFSWNV